MEQQTESKKFLIQAAWKEVSEVYTFLETSGQGLSIKQVEERRKRDNPLLEKREDTIWYRIRRAFLNPFTGVLIFLAGISFLTNHWMQADEQRNLYSSFILVASFKYNNISSSFGEHSLSNFSSIKIPGSGICSVNVISSRPTSRALSIYI